MAWLPLCKASELVDGEGKFVKLPDRNVAVVLKDGQVHVFDDHCPHAGASLSGGTIDEGCVICPWHQWTFSLEDGTMAGGGRARIRIYPVRVENDQVLAEIEVQQPSAVDVNSVQI